MTGWQSLSRGRAVLILARLDLALIIWPDGRQKWVYFPTSPPSTRH